MTLNELADLMLEVVSEHFPDDSVVWAEQYTPKSRLPQTTLKLKDMITPRHPVNKVKDGAISSYYECTKILEINRYADSVAGKDGEINSLENPAVNELAKFLLYLQSEAGTAWAYVANVCVEGMGPVRDLSELDSTHYRYRAMQEYTVRFMLEYKEGEAAVYIPEVNKKLETVNGPAGYFENVDMEDKYE